MKRSFPYLICLILAYANTGYTQMRDPTQPIIEDVASTDSSYDGSYNLQSILIAPTRQLAMINDQLIGVGSSIQGARVLAIDRDHVVLLITGQKKSLYLFGRRLWKTY